jgi:proton-translocating NAD(P)+ transhydrogenase subunit beta
MEFTVALLVDVAIIVLFMWGVSQFRSPKKARRGNLTAAFALAAAVAAVMWRNRIVEPGVVVLALLIGSAAGWRVAMRVNMIQIPAMVAFQHGAGGIAAFLVSFIELLKYGGSGISVAKTSGLLGLVIGAATFSGSMIASGKLANVIKQTPRFLPRHALWVAGLILLIILFSMSATHAEGQRLALFLLALVTLSVFLGLIFSLRIGGADMPVLISFLNATAGLAAAFCGVIVGNRLLVACGATVAASGSILTYVMCKAMNRSLLSILTGYQQGLAKHKTLAAPQEKDLRVGAEERSQEDPLARAVAAGKEAKKVIIVPGYGMALAQAQFKVAELANLFESSGKQVKFAIHPVAGRMPGHMNVLLAEADIPYDKLFEMEQVNGDFQEADLALVIGACDVVNPAAISIEGTPISGMPILKVHEAKKVIVCNLDERPGYSGVENPLYRQGNVIMILGEASENLERLIKGLSVG